jgi:hypothetical protein
MLAVAVAVTVTVLLAMNMESCKLTKDPGQFAQRLKRIFA